VPIYRLDMLEDSRFDYTDFIDVDHINVRGAKKLTRIFNEFMQESQK